MVRVPTPVLALLGLLAAAPVAAAPPPAAAAPSPAARAAGPATVPAAPSAAAAPGVPVVPDEVHREAAALFDLTGGEAMVGKMLDALRGQIAAVFAQHGAAADNATRVFDELLLPEFKAHLSELRPAMIEIWADNFTVDELRGLHAFYDTPLGRKVMERQPMVSQQALAVGAAWGKRVAQDAVARHADELRQRGIKL